MQAIQKNKDTYGVRALHPRPEGRGFPRKTDKFIASLGGGIRKFPYSYIKWYTAFDLSQEIGSTTRDVNEKLMKLGFQEAPYGEWMPTKLGQIFCRILDTGKKHGNNTPIKQIQWDYHILNLLKTA